MTFSEWVDLVHESGGLVTTVPASAPPAAQPYVGQFAAWYRNDDYVNAINMMYVDITTGIQFSDPSARFVYVVAPPDAQSLTLWERAKRAITYPDIDQVQIWGFEAQAKVGQAAQQTATAVGQTIQETMHDVYTTAASAIPTGAIVAGIVGVAGLLYLTQRRRR